MKKAIDYFKEACEEFESSKALYDEPFFVATIKRAQIDAIDDTALKCSQKAKMYVNYEHSLGGFNGLTKHFKEKKRTNYKESLSIDIKVDKESILQIAEQLKKELE